MFPRRSAEEFLPDNTLCNPTILRRCEREEGRAEWQVNLRHFKRKQDFPPGVVGVLPDGGYALTDDFDTVPLEWTNKGTVQCTVPRRSRIQFGELPSYSACV